MKYKIALTVSFLLIGIWAGARTKHSQETK
jgi:hypothetical protein